MHPPDLESVNYTLGILGIAAILVGWWRGWLESPKRRQERQQRELARARDKAVAEAILGEPEVQDLAGKVLTPAKPGLVSRTTTLEQAVSTLVDQDTRITHLENNHGSRIAALEDKRVNDIVQAAERAATAAVSAEMLRLVNERDTTDGHATEPSGELGN